MTLKTMIVCVLAATAACRLAAFETPCKAGHGVSVSIPGFQDSVYTNRTEGWTKNKCREIGMNEPLGFQAVVSNLTDRPICGKISVSLTDDWRVDGEQGEIALPALGVKSLDYVATPGMREVSAHYPIHVRFTPDGAAGEVHVTAMFRTVDPAWAPRPKKPPEPTRPGVSEEEWKAREAEALKRARQALSGEGEASEGCYLVEDGGCRFGAGVVKGRRDLVDGAIAFTDGVRSLVYRGFEVMVDDADALGDAASVPVATEIGVAGGALKVKWTMPGVRRSKAGRPRFTRINLADCSERIARGYLGTGVVLEDPGTFTCSASGIAHSTRHVGVDYANGLSLVHATDTIQQSPFVAIRERNMFSTLTGNDATFFLVPGAKGAFDAARRFRAVSGYRKSPGHDAIASRVCLDKWFDTNYAGVAESVKELARYGVTDCIYVKHDWRRWGWDYADPECDPLIQGVGSHAASARACQDAGMLYVPHDNYIDVYPYSDNFTYRDVAFDVDGFARPAFYSPERNILAYRWLPQSPLECARRNMAIMKRSFAPDGIFLDVFTAHCPHDYLERDGTWHSRQEMSRWFGRTHRLCLKELGHPAGPSISEGGQDHLVGVIDAGQSDHYGASYFIRRPGAFADSERVPWHDIVTHGYFTLFAGGIDSRYSQTGPSPASGGDLVLHGYGSDDYLSNTLVGGRNPMASGNACEATVRTYWMLHDICASLSRAELVGHEFGPTIHQQHTTFANGAQVWTNRSTNELWAASGVTLPPYGFVAKAPGGLSAGSILAGGRHVAFSRSPGRFFLDVCDGGGVAGLWAVKAARSTCVEYPAGAKAISITPLRRSESPYSVELNLGKMGLDGVAVKGVAAEDVDESVGWTLEDGILKVEVPAKAFRCVVKLASGASKGPRLMMIRLQGSHTASDGQWAKTFGILRENRAACDEVWFSTGQGCPTLEWHREHAKRLGRYAEQLRSAGIVPSLQFQATIGHADHIFVREEGVAGKTWSGFTGRGGTESLYCACPRQPGFLEYYREAARIYAEFRPAWVWIDDDLRIGNHGIGSPADREKDGWIGCWCPTCIAAFNAETGGAWTRETLDEAMKGDSALFDRWEKFSFDGIAHLARIMAEETHRVSPETRLAYQHCTYRNDSMLSVYRAFHDATGLGVGGRIGGGAYYDMNPNAQMIKAFEASRERRRLGDPEWVEAWCAEVETWPRAFSSRTAQSLLDESLVNLAVGMNCLSFLIMDPKFESDEWYGENLLAPLAAERPLLEAYRRCGEGTVPAGFSDATTATAEALYSFALAGVPVAPGPGMSCGEVTDADLAGFSIKRMSSAALLDLRNRLDRRSGGKAPVLVETPSVGLVLPRVAPDGALRSVVLVNARIDLQKPVRMRLRNVPPDVRAATWWALRENPVDLPVEMQDGGEAVVTIPAVSAWNCGWLSL